MAEWRYERHAAFVLGLLLVGIFVFHGGPTTSARAFTHLILAAVLSTAALLAPNEWLASKGLVRRVAIAGSVVLAAQLTGLLPIPAFVGPLLSPSWAFDRGAASWDWSTLYLDGTLQALSSTTAVIGIVLAVIISTSSRKYLVWVLRLGACALLLFFLAALASPLQFYRGSVTPPFHDANHFGAALLLTFPAVLGSARRRERDWLERVAWAFFALLIVATIAWVDSLGPTLACLLVAVPVLTKQQGRRALAYTTLGGVLFVLFLLMPQRGGVSHGRFAIWWKSLRGLLDHWLLGSGSGSFARFIEPYRTDIEFHSWNHAHNDWLEWIVEGGMVGIVALIVVLLLLLRAGTPRTQLPLDRRIVGFCLFGMAMQAALEFPNHLPFIALSTAAVWAWWRSTFFNHAPTTAVFVRAILLFFAVLNLGAMTYQARRYAVDHYATVLQTQKSTDTAKRFLRWVAPQDPRYLLDQAKVALSDGRRDDTIKILRHLNRTHPRAPAVLRPVATLARIAGAPDLALAAAERSKAWSPSDTRNWRTWAQVTSAVAPERTFDVWRATLAHGFTMQNEAWQAFPEPILWAPHLDELPLNTRIRMANKIAHAEPLVGRFAYEMLRNDHPDAYPRGYMDTLLVLKDYGAALSYWNAMPPRIQNAEWGLKARANIALAQGDIELAAEAWKRIWNSTGDTKARIHSIELFASVVPPQLVVERIEGTKLDQGRIAAKETLLLADAYRRTGRASECVAEIAGRDFSRTAKKIRRQSMNLQAACGRPDATLQHGRYEQQEPHDKPE